MLTLVHIISFFANTTFSNSKQHDTECDELVHRPKEHLTTSFHENIERIKKTFFFPLNQDFSIRSMYIPTLKKEAILFFLSGMTNETYLEERIIQPIMSKSSSDSNHLKKTDSVVSNGDSDVNEKVEDFFKTIPSIKTKKGLDHFDQVVQHILSGHTVLLIDGFPYAITIETEEIQHRPIGQPEIEASLIGPKEAFVESSEVNRALIRKQVRDASLVTEKVSFGSQNHNEVSIMYINDVVNPELVENVRQRIGEIEADYVQNLSILEQHIEDRPYSLVPTILLTERPDRAASFLMEGHIIVLMDSSPECLIVPVTFWSFFHTPEDQYNRWPYGNWIRLTRLFAFLVAILAPASYIATSSFHVEAIPINLLLTIASTRGGVPFPTLFELLLIEICFDIVREAGTRFPTKGGPVVALIGAFIIAYATIEAGLMSPITIAIVGFSSLASYTIPINSFTFAVRIARFGFIGLSAIMGFFGIAIGVQMCVAYLASVKSFGVAFISPMSPHYPSSKDMLIRLPVWKQWLRPMNVNPLKAKHSEKPEGGE